MKEHETPRFADPANGNGLELEPTAAEGAEATSLLGAEGERVARDIVAIVMGAKAMEAVGPGIDRKQGRLRITVDRPTFEALGFVKPRQ